MRRKKIQSHRGGHQMSAAQKLQNPEYLAKIARVEAGHGSGIGNMLKKLELSERLASDDFAIRVNTTG